MRVPAVVLARMVLIAGIDMLLGLVPLAGDIADVFWKADLRNMALLERHARPGVTPTRSDYWFVLGCIGAARGHRSGAGPDPGLVVALFLMSRLFQGLRPGALPRDTRLSSPGCSPSASWNGRQSLRLL